VDLAAWDILREWKSAVKSRRDNSALRWRRRHASLGNYAQFGDQPIVATGGVHEFFRELAG
jgi:hypothetical protein